MVAPGMRTNQRKYERSVSPQPRYCLTSALLSISIFLSIRFPGRKKYSQSQKGGDVQRITTAPPFRRNFQQSQAAYVHPTATQSYTGPPQQFPQQGYAAPPAQGYPFPRARTTTRSSKRRRTSQLFSSPAKVKSLLHHA